MKARGSIRIAVCALVIACFCAITAQKSAAQVAGGKHDLSFGGNANFQYFTDQVCIFCHTPHSSNSNQSYSTDPSSVGNSSTLTGEFLWNRATPEGRTWQMYTSDTMSHSTSMSPGKLSLLCLSCHDGVGAMNVLINYNWEGQPIEMPGLTKNQFGDFSVSDSAFGALNIGEAACDGGLGTSCSGGTNLQNDHPVGFVYGGSATDPFLRDIDSISDPAVRERMNITGGRMECSSCHDPHRTNTGGNMFLVTTNAQSNLCFACHIK